MLRPFLQNNWLAIVIIGIIALLYFDASSKSEKKDRIIEEVKSDIEDQKVYIDSIVEVLKRGQVDSEEVIKQLGGKTTKLEKDIKELQDDKTDVDNNVPGYDEPKLDSVLTNHRHIRTN